MSYYSINDSTKYFSGNLTFPASYTVAIGTNSFAPLFIVPKNAVSINFNMFVTAADGNANFGFMLFQKTPLVHIYP